MAITLNLEENVGGTNARRGPQSRRSLASGAPSRDGLKPVTPIAKQSMAECLETLRLYGQGVVPALDAMFPESVSASLGYLLGAGQWSRARALMDAEGVMHKDVYQKLFNVYARTRGLASVEPPTELAPARKIAMLVNREVAGMRAVLYPDWNEADAEEAKYAMVVRSLNAFSHDSATWNI